MGPKTATHVNYASIPGRSRLGLNSRQVRTGPQFQAGPDWASIPGRSRLGLNSLRPLLRLTCPPLPEFPFMRHLRAAGLHPFSRGLRAAGLHCFTGGLDPGFAGCGASPLHLGLGASRTQISEFSGSGIGVKIRGSPFKRGGHSGHVAAV